MEPDEALDLIATLPDGSAYVRSMWPARAWSESRVMTADLVDTLWSIAFARAGLNYEDAPRVTRPSDALARIAAAERSKRTRDVIENTEWEEV